MSTTDFDGNKFVKRTAIKHFVMRNVNCLLESLESCGKVITKEEIIKNCVIEKVNSLTTRNTHSGLVSAKCV